MYIRVGKLSAASLWMKIFSTGNNPPMKITASIKSNFNQHEVVVQTEDAAKSIGILPKASGYGSSINGGELLMLSLATCFCNDLYREAGKRKLVISGVEVLFQGDFGAEGAPGTNLTYSVRVDSEASASEIRELIEFTDRIAEIHNTVRKGVPVTLSDKAFSDMQ